jgi:hypothetical protein
LTYIERRAGRRRGQVTGAATLARAVVRDTISE